MVVASALEGIQVVSQHASIEGFPYNASDAVETVPCGHCGGTQHVVVARCSDQTGHPSQPSTKWVRCISCLRGSVLEAGAIHPNSKPLRTPRGLPPTDAAIWEEVRACLGAQAHAAAVMLCRKLLLHVAVANGLEPKNEKDRAPSFLQAVDHLQAEEVITKKMRPWVDRIKDVGNEGAHELKPVTRETALDVARFTEQLLVLAYELTALMEAPPDVVESTG